MPRSRLAVALCVALALAPSARAQAPERTHDITVDDYFTQADIFSIAQSPSGRLVAYTEGRWQKSTDDRKTDLWVAGMGTGVGPTRLTSDRASDRSPQWGARSEHIYFLGNRKREGEKRPPYDGKTQVWRVALEPPFGTPRSGVPQAVTRVPGGVQMFALARDSHSLYYVTLAPHTDGPFKHLREKFSQVEYGHGVNKFSVVWRLDLQTWRAEKVLDAKRVIKDMAVTADGRRLAMITTPDDTVVSFEGRSRVDVLDTKTKKVTTLPDKVYRADARSPYGWLEHLAWSPDGERLAFNVIFDGYPAEIILADLKETPPRMVRLARPASLHVKGYGSPLGWSFEGALHFLGERKARVHLYRVAEPFRPSPQFEPLTHGDVVVEGFSVGSRIRIPKFKADQYPPIVVMAGPSFFPDIFMAGGKKPMRLTKVNPQADTWKLPKLSVVTWKAPDGTPVEGILELPPDHKPGQKLPLVVEIHGGPTTASTFKLQYWIYGRTLLPAKGYAVLVPNYRGSTGYGDKFLTDLIGRENDLDVSDILAGVDSLVEAGIADPERLAVSGWSNGGYLTNCLITKTTRFKAAISGAGIVDAVMEFGSNDEPAYTIVFKQGFPWTSAARYQKASPSYALNKVKTPTLIHVGAQDDRCPPGHSRMLYRALKHYVGVPTELLVYPGEGHGLMKYRNRRAKLEWDLAWLERYVLGRGTK
jgi:dipeptidyl aminopeptidase/acylaminoacyl peptidase